MYHFVCHIPLASTALQRRTSSIDHVLVCLDLHIPEQEAVEEISVKDFSTGTCPSYRKCISNDLNILMISKAFGTPAQNNFEHVKKESQIMSLTILTVSYGELSRNVEGKIARASIAGGHYAADASWLGRCSALLCPSVSPKCSNDGVDSFWDKMLCFRGVAQSNLDTSANGTRKLI